MDRVEFHVYAINVCVVGVINYQDVINIVEICYDLVLVREVCYMCVSSRFCRKNSAIMPEVGAPMARPSCWIRIFPLFVM